MSEHDYYQLLELEYDASQDEVRVAYERLRQLFEADALASYSLFGDDEAANMRERLDRAFAVLSDDNRREEYDAEIGNERAPEERTVPQARVRHDEPSVSHTASFDSVVSYSEPEKKEQAPPPANEPIVAREAPLSVPATVPANAVQPIVVPETPPVTIPTPVRESHPSQPASAPVEETPAEPVEAQKNEAPKAADDSEKVGLTDSHEEGQYSGGVLARLREGKGMSLEDIAKKTKISLAHLRALEANTYDKLPARVYVRGFVTQYAKCLALNPLRVADSYLQIYDRYFVEKVPRSGP